MFKLDLFKVNERMNKKILWKKSYKKCAICGCENYDLLDVHRIIPGSEGGKYEKNNIIVLCANDHRRSHSGDLLIKGKFNSSIGEVVCFVESGEEKIKLI